MVHHVVPVCDWKGIWMGTMVQNVAPRSALDIAVVQNVAFPVGNRMGTRVQIAVLRSGLAIAAVQRVGSS